MRPAFEEGRIDLPYGTPDAIEKVRPYRRQLVNFTEETAAKRRANVRVDLVMAGWFPWQRISSALRNGREPPTMKLGSELSYPTFGGSSAPWNETGYPGGTQYPRGR